VKLIDFLDRGARLHPDRICVQHDDGSCSHVYRDVAQLTHRIANGMIAAGVGRGDAFAVYSPNHALGFVALLGALRAGARWINVNARNALDENIHCLNASGCGFLFYHSALEGQVQAIRQQVPGLKGTVCIDRPAATAPSLLEWAEQFAPLAPDYNISDEEIAALFNTGGTTGRPKSALLSNRALTAMTTGFLSYMHFDTPPSYLLATPMTHAAGVLAFPLLSSGATIVLMSEPRPARVLAALQAHRINVVFLPPTLIYMLLAEPDVRNYDYSALKYFVYAAAPMAPEKLIEALKIFGPVMMQTYGQVEAPMLVTCLTPFEHVEALADLSGHRRLASCGRQSHVARVEIMGPDGALLGADERGEIVCRGSLVMSGYDNAREETEAVGRHGWHHTGDVGYRDADGYVYIVDRLKDMIISGGFNVYSAEVEAFLLSLPQIRDCAVIGVPDEKWGEAVTAVLELKPGCRVEEHEVIARCKERLGSIKAPKSVQVWASLPRSAVGKVLKREIRARFWKDSGRSI
jgi:acyl-CoA synthetase (AMP-forming)/AMP-acid ligase II